MKPNEIELLRLLGSILRAARLQKGMTQAQVAHRARIDVRYYSRIERGRINVTFVTLTKVSEALNVFPLVLLCLTEQKLPTRVLELLEGITHLIATRQVEKVLQTTDFLSHVLNVKCTCPDSHCPTWRTLRPAGPVSKPARPAGPRP